MQAEIVTMWVAVTLYALAAVGFASGFVFRFENALTVGLGLSAAGLAVHAAGIAVRWVRVGHGPYLGFYEVVSSYAFFAVAIFLALAVRRRGLRVLGVAVMPVVFLFIGGAMLAPKADQAITPTLASWWLNIHVLFAKLTYSSFIVAFALGVLFLLRAKGGLGRFAALEAKLPSQAVVDDLTFKFATVGFIFLGIMIAAGAIWANEAWGRYWDWDPIETWSLIAWLVYAVVLHLRLTMGWRGERFAWAVAAALPIVLFAMLGVPIVYDSIHGAYLKGV
ncbi:MAG: cytochrome C biogenesis protein [Actinobacteria bacterium]|nr:MAG: cytochrome C biogenesis protein [Actinomycetota bacterium]